MRTPGTWRTVSWLSSLALLLAACGDGEQTDRRDDISECDRYDTCDELGPFGDGDYERWGDEGEQGSTDQEESEPPPEEQGEDGG
jgi:hypothetical protein